MSGVVNNLFNLENSLVRSENKRTKIGYGIRYLDLKSKGTYAEYGATGGFKKESVKQYTRTFEKSTTAPFYSFDIKITNAITLSYEKIPGSAELGSGTNEVTGATAALKERSGKAEIDGPRTLTLNFNVGNNSSQKVLNNMSSRLFEELSQGMYVKIGKTSMDVDITRTDTNTDGRPEFTGFDISGMTTGLGFHREFGNRWTMNLDVTRTNLPVNRLLRIEGPAADRVDGNITLWTTAFALTVSLF
uniref:Uncharacterized protein n=1 Tax=viral metagenome TaxID=1070528 RepID=A0A6C0IVM9_9ZZZZ